MTVMSWTLKSVMSIALGATIAISGASAQEKTEEETCLLYTSDAADE